MTIATITILASQLTGCGTMDSREMVKMLDKGESITLEVNQPSYDVVVQGEQQKVYWTQLDQLKTYNQGFRQGFDEVFNINIVTEQGVNGKSGCLYVDEAGDRNGNTTLEDALRNKVFVKDYWQDTEARNKLVKLASEVYTDIDGNTVYGITGAINAYYNLLEDATNPSSFNPTQSLTREQFYTLVFKTEEGVRDITIDNEFEKAIGGVTEYSRFAQEVDEYGFLSVSNKSLDAASYKGSISRAEAVYMVVNKHFSEELAKVTGKEKSYNDAKNGGDVALKLGFKYKDKKTKEILEKDRWQSYTLATMLQNPNKGMQEDIYKALVVAKKLNLIEGEESRWDEAISKAEAIQLIMKTHLAKNELYGFLSSVEYGKINLDKFQTATEGLKVLGETEEGLKYGDGWIETPESQIPADPNKELSSGLTLWEAKKLIEDTRKNLKSLGYSDAEIRETEEMLYRDFGTTASEVERCPDRPATATPAPVIEQKPAQGQTPSGGQSGGQSQGQQQPSSGGGSGWDNLPDFLKDSVVEGGSTTSNPDFKLE